MTRNGSPDPQLRVTMLRHTSGPPFLGGGGNKDEGEASPHLTSPHFGVTYGPKWREGLMDSL